MKLIIDLPDKTIAHIRSDYGHKYFGSIRDDDKKIIMKAIYNGTPLEEELENQKTGHWVEIDDYPHEDFECDCCGQEKYLAGSVEYSGYRLCNDCVLLAETGFALGKIKDVQELVDAMEDSRLEGLCNIIKEEERKANN